MDISMLCLQNLSHFFHSNPKLQKYLKYSSRWKIRYSKIRYDLFMSIKSTGFIHFVYFNFITLESIVLTRFRIYISFFKFAQAHLSSSCTFRLSSFRRNSRTAALVNSFAFSWPIFFRREYPLHRPLSSLHSASFCSSRLELGPRLAPEYYRAPSSFCSHLRRPWTTLRFSSFTSEYLRYACRRFPILIRTLVFFSAEPPRVAFLSTFRSNRCDA